MLNIFKELENTSSSLDKIQILKNYSQETRFSKVLHYALNPHMRFHVRKIPEYKSNGLNYDIEYAFKNLDMLSQRKVTGNLAIDLLHDTLASVTPDTAKIVEKIINKDLRCGVATSTVNKVFPKLVPTFKVALCADFEERYIPNDFWVEPKHDGMRVEIFVEGKDVTFMSRSGKEIETLDHTIPEILELYGDMGDIVIDSEAVSSTFQTTVSDVRRLAKNKKGEAKLVLFDIVKRSEFDSRKCDTYQMDRRKILETPFPGKTPTYLSLSEVVYFDGTLGLTKMEFIDAVYADFRAKGYEGAVVKDLLGKNKFKRDRGWMKIKPEITIDVEITGTIEGTKKNVGKLGAATFDYEGKPARVGGGFSDAERQRFWDERNLIVGDIWEVEIMEATETGSPRHARFIRERTHKGEKL